MLANVTLATCTILCLVNLWGTITGSVPPTLPLELYTDYEYLACTLQKQVGSFNHSVVTPVADKLEQQWGATVVTRGLQWNPA